jgi:uncharacterized protein (DUF362 family)
MEKPVVSLTRYESSPASLLKAVEEAEGFRELQPGKRVLIKPNLVGWDPVYPIAPYGVYTTSRLVEDMVVLLKDYGVTDIAVGEGSAPRGGKKATSLKGTKLIFSALGYDHLKERYGVKLVDFFDEPFVSVNVEGFSLNFAKAALEADFVINMPVLKTHNQTTLSLGLKNLKGCIDLKSRRLCHHENIPLDFFCGLFAEVVGPGLTVLDGIYGLEKGPYYLGTAHRMNVIIASRDPLAVDVVGATVAGYDPEEIEHLAVYAKRHERSPDPHDFILRGPQPDEFKRRLKCDFSWREDNTGPRNWDKLGISGISIPKYDQTICTGCSSMYNPMLMLITSAYKGGPFEEIEVLSGKRMTPSPGFKKTVLFGNCMIRKNRKDPNIRELVCIKGCPVTMEEIIGKLDTLGLDVDVGYFARFRESLAKRYDGNADFEPEHYFMPGARGKPQSMPSSSF